MARTYADYTGDGSNTDFAIIFDYIKTSHVAVEVNEGPAGGTNVWVRKVLGATDDYTVVTSPTNKVVFNSPPGNNVRVRVLRDSEAHIGIVDFANGSVLTETELDNSYEHNRYLAEEAEEGITGGALVKNTNGQFDADGLRLENLASPDSDDDAVTKGYADGRYVDEAGDTMTGNLAMSGNDITGVNSVQGLATPASDNHAANKKYVDDQDALQVTKTGDTMSGALTLPDADPTNDNHAARKAYVDNATAALTNDKVSKSGDTMTGALTLPDADPTNGNHATRKTYVDAQIATTLATGVAGGPIDTVNIADGAVETAKIENDAVTFAKMQDINTDKVIGRTTAGSGDPEEVPILDEDNMTSNSDTSLATQQSIKAYVDGAVSGVGGEDNVQADWNETNNTSDAFIQNKPSLATVATTGDYSDLSGTPTIPTNNNELTNGAGYITDGDVASNSAVQANTAKVSNATHTGDVTGDTALTLATVNSNVGSFTNATVTVNAKGLVTAASSGSVQTPEIHSFHTAPILFDVADKISVNDFSEGIDTTSSNATKIDQAVGDGGTFKMFKTPASGTCILEIDAALQDTDNDSGQSFELDLISCTSETGVTKTSDGSVSMTTLVAGAVTGSSSTAGTRGSSRVKYQKVMANSTFFYLKVTRNSGATSCNLTATVKVTTY
jgi:hypothetical protein